MQFNNEKTRIMKSNDWNDVVDLSEKICGIFLSRMDSEKKNGNYKAALNWGEAAARFVSKGGGFRKLGWPEIENKVIEIGKKLFFDEKIFDQKKSGRVLHVLTEAYELFGHTKLCRKWISSDQEDWIHDVVVISQRGGIPYNLNDTVKKNGGKVYRLDRHKSIIERARELRQIAYENAQQVILHIHPFDLTATVAFSTDGGPPVALVNHADHVFWLGAKVADIVIDIRESGQRWALEKRGINNSKILPIPIDEKDETLYIPDIEKEKIRVEMRKKYEIPKDAVVFLTIGGARKYEPIGNISFIDAAEKILNACENAWIVAVGPSMTGEWKRGSRASGNRLMALGNQKKLGEFHCMADAYLEGIPIGSLTALLEAGLNGLPCVRAPLPQEPPYCADGAALFGIRKPEKLEDYINNALVFARDAQYREKLGKEFKEKIKSVHCGDGWLNYLKEATSAIPDKHSLKNELEVKELEGDLQDYWLSYTLQNDLIMVYSKIFINALEQTIYCVKESRLSVEKYLPDIIAERNDAIKPEQRLINLLLPEMKKYVDPFSNSIGPSRINLYALAKEIMTEAVGENRRFYAILLWLKIILKRIELLNNQELWKGFLKAMPFSLTIAEKLRK